MKRQRKTLNASDLTGGALVQSGKTGRVYKLGPPKLKSRNCNVVNHCQLYYRNGKLALDKWYNLQNLKDAGFKLFVPLPSQLSLVADRKPELAAAPSTT